MRSTANLFRLPAFCLLYHWRLLLVPAPPRSPSSPIPLRYWPTGVAPRRWSTGRAMTSPTTALVFLQRLPRQLYDWLRRRLHAGGAEARAAIEMVDATLLRPDHHHEPARGFCVWPRWNYAHAGIWAAVLKPSLASSSAADSGRSKR